jgi:hypothetical protein
MKPVDLVRRAITNTTSAVAVVLDPFAGSGTTLIVAPTPPIASHEVSRAWFVMPGMVDHQTILRSTLRSMSPAPYYELPSKTRINKCGDALRRLVYTNDYPRVDDAEIDEAIRVVSTFRAAHAYPMQKIRYGLRSMVRTEGAQEVLAQRLKRVPRIIRKLHRMEKTNLARLEDIGGCRAVLANGPELERVRARVVKNWRHEFGREPRDYISQPKAIGYRAVHFVVKRDDRAIEVQLRTRGQQAWADAVEQADARLKLNLKDGTGPAEMVEYFSAAGEVIYLREYGQPVPSDVGERFNEARRAVVEAGYYEE